MSKMFKFGLIMALLLAFIAVLPAAAQEDRVVVVVGTDSTYPPFEYIDENGDFVGFDIDLFSAIAADAGFEVEFVTTAWDGIFAALAQGEFDVVISAVTITPEREETINFSDPYFNAGQSIAVSATREGDVVDADDLVGLRVGVQLGTTGDEFASSLDGVEVLRFDDIILAFQALSSGDVDAVVNDFPVSADIIANNPGLNVVIVATGLTVENYGIAVNPDLSDLLDQINVSLANIIEDGTYAEIHRVWFGQDPPAEFLPGGADVVELDRSTPEGAALALILTFFEAANQDPPDPSLLLEYACEGASDSPLLPDAETLSGFTGIFADVSKMTLNTTENEDGSVTITLADDAELTLIIGDVEQALPGSVLAAQLGITDLRFVDEMGTWLLCP